MWTRPIFPSSSCTNAPYGVMRWTRPSTTAPTSSSAIGTPFRRWTRTSDPKALSHRPPDPSTAAGHPVLPTFSHDQPTGDHGGVGGSHLTEHGLHLVPILTRLGGHIVDAGDQPVHEPELPLPPIHRLLVGQNVEPCCMEHRPVVRHLRGTPLGLRTVVPCRKHEPAARTQDARELSCSCRLVGGEEERIDAHDGVDGTLGQAGGLERSLPPRATIREPESLGSNARRVQRRLRDVHPRQVRPRLGRYPQAGSPPTTPDIGKLLALSDVHLLDEALQLRSAEEAVRSQTFGIFI